MKPVTINGRQYVPLDEAIAELNNVKGKYVPLSIWAKKNGIEPNTARIWVQRGRIEFEKLHNNMTFVPEDMPLPIDKRVKKNKKITK